MNETELRRKLVRYANKLDAQGLNRGTSGNLSARFGEGMLITPSGMGAEGLSENDIVFVHMDGTSRGRWQPSSEWLFHRDILAQRAEAERQLPALVRRRPPAWAPWLWLWRGGRVLLHPPGAASGRGSPPSWPPPGRPPRST